MVRKAAWLLLILVGLVVLRKVAFEPPHWRPALLGALPESRIIRDGDYEVVSRLDEQRPVLVSFDESKDAGIGSMIGEGAALRESGRHAGRTRVAVGRIGVALEHMPALLVPSGGVAAYHVVLPQKAAFDAHLASWFPGNGPSHPLRFKMDVISEGRVTTVVDVQGPPQQPSKTSVLNRGAAALEKWFFRGARPKRWLLRQVEADLSAWSGRPVVLRFRVEEETGGAPSAAIRGAPGTASRPGAVGVWGAPALLGARSGRKPNLLFLVIDGLSPNFTDCLEDRAWTDTPVIAGLCRSGEVVRRMYTAANGTRASIAALAYGARASDLLLPIYDREIPDRVRSLRAWGPQSLFEELAERGYRTAGIHDNVFSVETHEAGYDLGIEESYVVHGTMQDTPNIVRMASNWIRNHRSLPFAMYVHVDVTHDMFKVPPLRDMVATAVRAPRSVFKAFRYASGAHYSDRVAGWFRDLLKEEGLSDDTIFVVLSDHGNLFSRDKKRAYFSKQNGRWQWNKPYGWHGGTSYEDDLRVLWVVNGPGVRPGVREFGWLPDEATRWAKGLPLRRVDPITNLLVVPGAERRGLEEERGGVRSPSAMEKDSALGAQSCRPIDMQMGEAWVCPDGFKFVHFLEGIRVKGDGAERPAADEAWRVSDDFRESVLSGAEDEEARRQHPHPEAGRTRGWVLRIPTRSSIEGSVEWIQADRRADASGTATVHADAAVASDEDLGCHILESGSKKVSFEARTQTEWCEFYFESSEPLIRLDLRENGEGVKALSLGPLGVTAKGSRFEFDSSKMALLLADKGMPSVFLTEFPSLYVTSRRAWAYSSLPTALSRQTPEVVQIMKDWGYLK